MASQTYTTINYQFVVAVFIGIILLIFLVGGGASTITNISQTLKSVPSFIWIIIGILILIKFIRK